MPIQPSPAPAPLKQQTAARIKSSSRQLREMLQDPFYMESTPMEVQEVMENAVEALEEALLALRETPAEVRDRSARSANRPTPKQGQFLAYIHAYMRSNQAGVAPTHAAMQRFFNLTPPSVNSMLARLEQRGFIQRTPGQARGITLTIDPALLPDLERPFS